MLEEYVFKQSMHNSAYCNVSVSFVHDDYRHDVDADPDKGQGGQTCTGPSVTLRLLLYYEAAVRRASRALTV